MTPMKMNKIPRSNQLILIMIIVLTSTVNTVNLLSDSCTLIHGDVHHLTLLSSISHQNESYDVVINASQYTGETDSERLQKALDDVPPEGAVVLISKGVWLACNLTAKSKTLIMGMNGTIIKRPNTTEASFITFENKSNFAIINVTFDGQNIPEATGILILGSKQFQIANNTFVNVKRNAIRISENCENFTIENNMFLNCDKATICIFGSPGSRDIRSFTVNNNMLINGSNNGKIGLAFAENGTIINNFIVNSEYGIGTRCISNILIKRNSIENCSSYGIYLGTQLGDSGSNNIEIEKNKIVNCKVGISRYYGSCSIYNVSLRNNCFVFNQLWDIHADFPATFINNTITSAEKVKIVNSAVKFLGNKDINDQPVLPADVNDDRKIDMWDIGIVARLYGASKEKENWDSRADVVEDGVMDMKDLAFIAIHYGVQVYNEAKS